MRFFATLLAALALGLLPLTVLAAGPVFYMDVCFAGIACMSNAQVVTNVLTAFFNAAAFICLAVFLIGAGAMVFSAGNDTLLQKGKGMLIGSMIGLALVVGSYGIYRTVVYILYAGP